MKNHNENHLPQKVPVTILTGFLGAGKTTLLNHILSNQIGLKTAVLVNEYGEIGIDNELIVKTGDEMVELSNGCVCCSINGELLEAATRILYEKEKIDYLVVETTGLADPLPVAMTFLGSELRDMTRLDSIITVIDSENFNDDLLKIEVGKSQILYGDILLINKCDLVDSKRIENIEKQLSEIKNDPRILKCEKANVPLNMLLSVGLFETDRVHSRSINNEHEHEHGHGHGHGHGHEDSIEGFTSLSFKSDKPFALRKFQNFLDNLLPPSVFRAKGILWFNESQRKHIFHLAGKRFSIDDSEWNNKKENKLVLIGRDIDREKLTKQLQDCIERNTKHDLPRANYD